MATGIYKPTPWSVDDGYSEEEFKRLRETDKYLHLDIRLYRNIVGLFTKTSESSGIDLSGMTGEISPASFIGLPNFLSTGMNWIYLYYYYKVYHKHQIEDYNPNCDSGIKQYDDWFDIAKHSFLITMPLSQILELSDYDRDGTRTNELTRMFGLHNSEDELRLPIDALGDYSIEEIKKTLENDFNPYMILSLIGEDVHIEEFNNLPYVVCTMETGSKLAISLSSKEIFYVTSGKLHLVSPCHNSYEYMFRKLGLPIQKVLNSVVVTHGVGYLPNYEKNIRNIDIELRTLALKALSERGYDDAKKLTKFSDFNY